MGCGLIDSGLVRFGDAVLVTAKAFVVLGLFCGCLWLGLGLGC